MKQYEKKSLIKFTSIYFFSTSFFIILLGYLYYTQQENQILQKYTMKMHDYTLNLKQTSLQYKRAGYSFEINNKTKFKYHLATKKNGFYVKSFPMKKRTKNIIVRINANIIDDELFILKKFTILLQIGLIFFFLVISYLLAKISLKPLNETISHLDRFIKDLIHDLNTPSTAILLNSKMLEKTLLDEKQIKKIKRIQNSALAISSLYENLEILLHKNLPKQKIDLFHLFEEKKDNFCMIYPNVEFELENKKMIVETNEKAINRIVDNILSNAFKYSKEENPFIQIKFKENTIFIIDNGKGMQYPKKIFERSYTENENENGHGIGMHIVHRLSSELGINIDITSEENIGTTVTIRF